MGEYFLVSTREECPSLGYRDQKREIFLHSSYAPRRESIRFINNRQEDIARADRIVVYGMGLGYHLQEVLKYKKKAAKVYVLELNKDVVPFFEKIKSVSDYKEQGCIFLISNNIDEASKFLKNLIGPEQNSVLIVHQPSLKTIPPNCYIIRELLEEFEMKRDSFQRSEKTMINNFKKNEKYFSSYYNLDLLKNCLEEFPLVIISAGPSLDNNKHLLPLLNNKAISFAVGSVVKPLIEMNYEPDAIVITDPLETAKNQLSNCNLSAPLFFFPTITPQILGMYMGPKVLVLQKGFVESEMYAKRYGRSLLETGGSVATTALELAIFFGANPIIFVGQDLAYSQNKLHASGTVHRRGVAGKWDYWLEGIDGRPVPSNRNLVSFWKWIKNKIKEHPEKRFINATEGGAHIPGTEVMPLQEVITQLANHLPKSSLVELLNNHSGG